MRRFAGLITSPAHAMMPTDEPLVIGTKTTAGAELPVGMGWGHYCASGVAPYEFLANPPSGRGAFSQHELFQRVGVPWKGCVESRTPPHDVTDQPATPTNIATQWWPAFWPDDGNVNNWITTNHNEPKGWLMTLNDVAILKYNLTAPKSIMESPPKTKGPNKGCPEPILPLTSNISNFNKYINDLSHWDSGGTVISEGVGWGWRVLSPDAPFTEGAPYGKTTRKILVVMSDGANEIMSTNNVWQSQYTAYGPLWWNAKFPRPWTYENGRKFLDERTLAACTNAKAAGVEIFMVLFRQADVQARTLFENCASSTTNVFSADSPAALENAFNDIAAKALVQVRITK